MLAHSPFSDFFFQTVLLATNQFVVILIILTGYTFLKKPPFGRTFFIFAFALILNPFLKSLFHIPLPPTATSEGWAFPSGHMLSATIFWSWLAWEYKNRYLTIFTTLLLTSYGFALIYFGFHFPLDIIGAVFFAILTLYLYHLLLKLPFLKNTPPLAGFLLTTIGIVLIFFIPNNTAKPYIWVGLGSLLGFASGWLISNKHLATLPPLSLTIKLSVFFFSLLGLALLNTLSLIFNPKFFIIITSLYFIIALWLTAIAQIIILKLLKKFLIKNSLKIV